MIQGIPTFFTQPFEHWFKVEIFRRILYVFLLLNTLSMLPAAFDLWAYEGMAGIRWDMSVPTFQQTTNALMNVLSHPRNAYLPGLYIWFIVGQITFLILGILRILPIISSIAVYFFTINLFLKGSLMFTGAEVLIPLILFYLIFIQRKSPGLRFRPDFRISRDEVESFTTVQNLSNHVFFLLILIQVCIVYFFSTFYKLLDENWVNGNAMMLISRVDEFSCDTMRFIFSKNYWLSAIVTYLVILYQFMFVILVWFPKVKVPLLTFGVLLHLGIAFGMGIFTFGIAMCLVYIPFLSSSQAEWIGRKLRLLG